MAGGSGTGTRFGRYELRRLLGAGGMGEVYEAYDVEHGRTVALKLLPPHYASDKGFRERFRREAQIAARLDEPHVVPIHDFGEIDGVLYIDMRLVRDGRNLAEVLAQDGVLTPRRAVSIVSQIAEALDAAHRDDLVHRDIKPENILVTRSDFAYLVDFGIARREGDDGLTAQGSAIGSLAYMAPERFDATPSGPACDIYSLGCLLHQMLTGGAPFGNGTAGQLVKAHMSAPPPRPSEQDPRIPRGFDEVIERALSKDPNERQRTAGELAQAASEVLTGHSRPTALTETTPAAGARYDGGRTHGVTVARRAEPPRANSAAAVRGRTRGPLVVGTVVVAAAALAAGAVVITRLGSDNGSAAAAQRTTTAAAHRTAVGPAGSPGGPQSGSGRDATAATTTITLPAQDGAEGREPARRSTETVTVTKSPAGESSAQDNNSGDDRFVDFPADAEDCTTTGETDYADDPVPYWSSSGTNLRRSADHRAATGCSFVQNAGGTAAAYVDTNPDTADFSFRQYSYHANIDLPVHCARAEHLSVCSGTIPGGTAVYRFYVRDNTN